ncbi:uncharacterized protein BDW70DRAFT_145163 [Aspergillus foveolatus]|uniref:uncharacterized protein n=1 Tax=Aspergillus foveolatus TaxID=210207 RepID=UPI003CCD701C
MKLGRAVGSLYLLYLHLADSSAVGAAAAAVEASAGNSCIFDGHDRHGASLPDPFENDVGHNLHPEPALHLRERRKQHCNHRCPHSPSSSSEVCWSLHL